MDMPRTPSRGWAKVTLGVSLLFAVGVFGYLALVGRPVDGVVLAVVVVAAGFVEYRRKRSDEITAERLEADAERRRRRREGEE